MVIRRQAILDTAQNLAADFLGAHRDEDECLRRGEIERAIAAGEVSEAEIVATFAEWLRKGLATGAA
jgi:hypothetical protein